MIPFNGFLDLEFRPPRNQLISSLKFKSETLLENKEIY